MPVNVYSIQRETVNTPVSYTHLLHMPMIADGIGVPMENLRLVQNHAGGTFGYKLSLIHI